MPLTPSSSTIDHIEKGGVAAHTCTDAMPQPSRFFSLFEDRTGAKEIAQKFEIKPFGLISILERRPE